MEIISADVFETFLVLLFCKAILFLVNTQTSIVARNSNSPSPSPPSTMLVQTMIFGPPVNIAKGEGGNF
jgi:hypothetical protein